MFDVLVFYIHLCCVSCLCLVPKEFTLSILELELQTLVRAMWMLDRTWILCKESQWS